ncbi:MAG: glycosyltransferase family 4 protein [Ferruginibacter sp.]
MKRKVLHVINSMLPGGAEVLLANSLAPGGLCEHTENHLAYFRAPSYLLDKLDKKVKVHFLDYKGSTDIFRLLHQLKKTIIDNKIDIVHTHLNPSGLYTHIICPENVLHVHTMHTTYSMNNEQGKIRLWLRKHFFLLKRNVNIILLSDYTRDDFLSHVDFKGKSFVLNNFVQDIFFDLEKKRHYLPGQELKMIALGTLKPLKNFEYLLEVFGHLKGLPVSLDIYGGGNKGHYEKVIQENGLKVRMMGHTQNLPDIISGYDMLIMPSKFEGFPLSVFEAMAAGLPLMLSDIAPLRSIVHDHAIYFDLGNAAAVADQVKAVLQNDIDITVMAVKAKQYAQKTVRRETYIKNLLDIYSRL